MSHRRIFVFGSNIEGLHGSGAALAAFHRGFPVGLGAGYHKASRCYAVPTMSGLHVMQMYIEQFLNFAALVKRVAPKTEFEITRLGCGIAGYKDADIAHLFRSAPNNCLFDNQWELGGWLPVRARYWGTHQ